VPDRRVEPVGPGEHNGRVSALARPGWSELLTQWTFSPIAVVASIVLAGWYVGGVQVVKRRAADRPSAWPARRSVSFALGLTLLIWTSCGFPQVYGRTLFWVWTAQLLVLWLLVPLVLLAGRPLHLVRALYGDTAPVLRLLRSKPFRVLGNPLVGPAVVPALSAGLFFGPLPGWAVGTDAVGWLLQAVLVLIGAAILLPLVGLDDRASSLAVGLSLAVGMFELVLDAVPGIVLRLNAHISSTYFDHHREYSWAPGQLHDQQIAGSILWCVAEVIDLPFLLLVFNRWIRTDAREAAEVDTILEAERVSRGTTTSDENATTDPQYRDPPWWLTDPAMQERMRGEQFRDRG
jgi:cytochrome c oxidase assembly factor CtaG